MEKRGVNRNIYGDQKRFISEKIQNFVYSVYFIYHHYLNKNEFKYFL